MDNEEVPTVEIVTSVSDDSNPNSEIFTKFFPSKEILSSSHSKDQRDITVSMEEPSRVPSEVDNEGVPIPIQEQSNNGIATVSCSLDSQYIVVKNEEESDGNVPSSLEISTKPTSASDKENELSSPSNDEDSSKYLSGSGLRWTENKTSRVGTAYQATQLPDAGSYYNLLQDDFDQLEQLLLADQIWDPMRATIQGMNDFVHQNCPSNKKEAALEFLHQRDYNKALFSEGEIDTLHVLDGSDWTLHEHDNFRRLMQQTRHNVHNVAKSMGKTINNCLTVYYKIINIRETRSSTKKFRGMKTIDEINELKDIGRSMRIEKRNRQKRSLPTDNSASLSNVAHGSLRQRRKASAPSDKVKNPKANQQRCTPNIISTKNEESEPLMEKKKTNDQTERDIARRKSPRTSKATPVRLSDEQSMEVILSSYSLKEASKQATGTDTFISSNQYDLKKFNESKDNEPTERITIHDHSNRSTRAAKAQALIALSRNTSPPVHNHVTPTKRNISNNTERRITRTMTQSNDTLHQNKLKQTQTSSPVIGFTCNGGNDKVKNEMDLTRNTPTTFQTRSEHNDDKDLWDTRYEALVQFKKQNGHCLVPKVYPENRQLSYWVFRQRGLYASKLKKKGGSNSILSDERIEKLKGIGFVFRAKHSKEQNLVDAARRQPQLDAKWNKFFDEFCKYREQTGSCLIPKVFEENQPLSSWAFTQRHQMKRRKDGKYNLLTEERIEKLDKIGFVWHAKQNKEWQNADRLRKQAMVESMWQSHYKSLIAFKRKHGHTRVPKVFKENQALSTWVFRQRAHYRRRNEGDEHAMTDERLRLLEKVGFQFRVRK